MTTTKRVRPIPPPQADYLVLQTISVLLTQYIKTPESIVIAEGTADGERLLGFSEMDAEAFVGACRRLRDEIDIRADNLRWAEEEWSRQRARSN